MSPPKTLRLAAVFTVLAAAAPVSAQSIVDEWILETKQHIHSMAISPDGKTLAAGNDNIHLYDLTTSEPRQKTIIEAKMFVGVRGLVFAPDSKRLAYGGADDKVHLWSVDGEPKELSVGVAHAGNVQTVAFSKDGKFLASGSSDRSIIVWKVTDAGKLVEGVVIKKDHGFRSVAFSGPTQMVAVDGVGTVRIINLKDGKYTVAKEDRLKGIGNDPNIAVRPDGRVVAVSADKFIALTGGLQGVYQGHTKTVTGLAFSPDGSVLASCGADGRLHMYAGTVKTPRVARERPDSFTAIAFTPPGPDGKVPEEAFLAAGTTQGKVFLYKVDLPDKKKK